MIGARGRGMAGGRDVPGDTEFRLAHFPPCRFIVPIHSLQCKGMSSSSLLNLDGPILEQANLLGEIDVSGKNKFMVVSLLSFYFRR
ncbi:hypothetical protein EON65_02150 [archaeon]|nr:MAG: hypothetical protein EON65_02150 [archaeon]